MLVLKDIVKDYKAGDDIVKALKGININFRKNEFVSILGHSGCGKTTMLNIVGGLDHYTSGDLIINGKSTKLYKDRDWDVYRNHRIGFIFQSYNLIPHQTVLGNVELALTIAGISKEERIERSKKALDKVGLSTQYYKKPNQLSGGQCQRVAIARALVNNPEILLADEPTGALDSETSVQIMELIKEISKERLVIMVTHNPELAEKYSTRIIRLLDGEVVEDTMPYSLEDEEKEERVEISYDNVEEVKNENQDKVEIKSKNKQKKVKKERAKMSLLSAFKLSARNLITKKGRTTLVGIAGSIGIIGVSLVLAFSAGIKGYVASMQDDMLSGNPIMITEQSYDLDAMSSMMRNNEKEEIIKKPNKATVDSIVQNISKMNNMMTSLMIQNDINQTYIDFVKQMPKDYYSAMKFNYGVDLSNNIYTDFKEVTNDTKKLSVSALTNVYTSILGETQFKDYINYVGSLVPSFSQAPNSSDYIKEQYDVYGKIATDKNEIMLVLDKDSAISDLLLARLGYFTQEEFLNIVYKASNNKNFNQALYKEFFDFDELLAKKFRWYKNDSVFIKEETIPTKSFNYYAFEDDIENTEDFIELKVSGVLIPKDNISYGCLKSGVYYTEDLINYVLDKNENSSIVEYAKAIDKNTLISTNLGESMGNVDTGIFYNYKYYYKTEDETEYVAKDAVGYVGSVDQTMAMLSQFMGIGGSGTGASSNPIYTLTLRQLGGNKLANEISIYPVNFDEKDKVTNYLDTWNEDGDLIINGVVVPKESRNKIKYTDSLALIINLINTMIDIISIALIAFTSISLVVSTVMIGIITYVSVVERIKEIGIIRALGGRKKDVSHLFNAETFIIGLLSGLIGIGVTYLISFIVNKILFPIINIKHIAALPVSQAIIMIVLSVVLTLISGLIPARSAAKKDPVIALRTE